MSVERLLKFKKEPEEGKSLPDPDGTPCKACGIPGCPVGNYFCSDCKMLPPSLKKACAGFDYEFTFKLGLRSGRTFEFSHAIIQGEWACLWAEVKSVRTRYMDARLTEIEWVEEL